MALSAEEKTMLRECICMGSGFARLTPARLEQISNMSDEEIRTMISDFKATKLTTIDGKIAGLQAKREDYV